MTKKRFGVIIFSLLAECFVFSQVKLDDSAKEESVTLTIEQAVEYAIKNNRTLKCEDIDLDIKKRASVYSWNILLPNATVGGTMKRDRESMTKVFEKEEDRWTPIGSVAVGWNFSAAMIQNIRISKQNYESGKITWEQNQKDMILNIKKLFYTLLLQQENLKIQKSTLENARQRMVQAQTSYKNGAIPELSLLQTQVNYQNTKPTVESAEQSLNQLLDQFAFLLGLPVGTTLKLDGSIEPKYIEVDVDNLLDTYGSNSLSVKNINKGIDITKLQLSATELGTWLPVLSVNYSWQPVYIGTEGAFHFSKDIGKGEKWLDNGGLTLTLTWNITNMLPFSSNRQQAKDLRASISKLELQRETVKEKQKMQVRKSVDTLKLTKMQIDSMSRNVTVAQRAYDSTFRQYKNGQTELLNLRDAENSLNQSKLALLNKKFEYISALMDLENTLNITLTE